MIFWKIIPPLGLVSWNVVLPRFVSLPRLYREDMRYERDWLEMIRTSMYDCLAYNLHRSTHSTSHRVSTSSGRPVDPRVPRRWPPRFLLGPGRARARPPPRRWTYPGRLRFRCHVSVFSPTIQRRHAILLRASLFLIPLSSFTYSYRSYFICPIILPERF